MAGAGYKLFNTGDVLTAAQVNTYLQEQVVMVFANAAARTTALSGVLAEGMVTYLKDTDALEIYSGAAWVGYGSGDITGITTAATSGLTGGVTSGTADLKFNTTAKGGLLVGTGSGTVSELAVGSSNQVLTVDSSTTTGLKWASAASSSPDYQLINAGGTSLTGATTITVSGISGKNDLIIIVQGVSTASASPYITFRLNADSTSGNYQYAYQGMQSTASIFYDYLSGAEIYSMRLGNSAADTGNGYLQISGANATGFKRIWGIGAGKGSTTKESWTINGVYKGTSAITSVSVLSDAGNFDAGTIYVYGA